MANGDDAAAIGMDTVAGTSDLRMGYDEDNKTRDYIAQHRTAGTHPASAITTGTLALARIPNLPGSKITSGTVPEADHLRDTDNGSTFEFSFPAWQTSASLFIGGLFSSAAAWSYAISGTRQAVWMDSNGALGFASSSRRFKQDITPAQLAREAILAIQVVQFRYIEQVELHGDAAAIEIGVIAEELHDLGLTWLVHYDDEGLPTAVHYDRLALALLPVIQDHEARLVALEGGA